MLTTIMIGIGRTMDTQIATIRAARKTKRTRPWKYHIILFLYIIFGIFMGRLFDFEIQNDFY